jgi:uncharacterized phosphosugar-binding protein
MATAYQDYLATLSELLSAIAQSQGERIEAAAAIIAECIAADGIIHVFGSGHSHMMAEEVFHRAGGLWPVNAMLDPNLTAFGTLRAGMVERTEGYAKIVLSSYDVQPGEVVIVVSNSGINPAPIEMAIEGRAIGAKVIAITSEAAYADATSRHSSGKKLADVSDLVVDSLVPAGDAVVSLPGVPAKVGAVSTALGAALMNMIMVEAAARLASVGGEPPVIASMNVPGGDDHNKALHDKYKARLPLLKG